MCPAQPLRFNVAEDKPKRMRFNLRVLSELPYHLTESNNTVILKNNVLFCYNWLYTKLQAMTLHDVLADFRRAADHVPKDVEIPLLESCLRIGAIGVREHAHALSFELIGRLLPYYEEHQSIRSLIQQCDTVAVQHNHLVPLYQCFEAPKGMLRYILEDIKVQTLDLKFSKHSRELVSVDFNGTVSLWNMQSGELTRTYPIPNLRGGRQRLMQSEDGKLLIVESNKEKSPIFVIDVKSLERKHKLAPRSTQSKRCFVVGDVIVRQKTIYDLKSGEELAHLDNFIESKKFLPCAITPNKRFILIAEQVTDRCHLSMFELNTRRRRFTLASDNLAHSFYVTPNSDTCYVGYDQDCIFHAICIDPLSSSFGKILYKLDCLKHLSQVRHGASPLHANGLTSIDVSSKNPKLVLLNVKCSQLLLVNVKSKIVTKLDPLKVSSKPCHSYMYMWVSKWAKMSAAFPPPPPIRKLKHLS